MNENHSLKLFFVSKDLILTLGVRLCFDLKKLFRIRLQETHLTI